MPRIGPLANNHALAKGPAGGQHEHIGLFPETDDQLRLASIHCSAQLYKAHHRVPQNLHKGVRIAHDVQADAVNCRLKRKAIVRRGIERDHGDVLAGPAPVIGQERHDTFRTAAGK
jgi:hypothetical protein